MANIHDLGETAIEQNLQEAGKTAERLTPDSIDSVIVGEDYYVFPGSTLTVCCLTLRNGYRVTGESASVSADNFDAEIGKRIARAEARDKIWQLEGYRLKQAQFERE